MSDPALFERLTVLSEPIRARLLRILTREELAVGELARVLQTSQPTVSRHLKLLDGGGWVQRRRVGTSSWFRVEVSELPDDSARLWGVVSAAMEAQADDPSSTYAEDVRRLERVLAQRTSDSAELFRRLGGRWDGVRRELFGEGFVGPLLGALLSPDWVVGDLGCGTGALLPLLATSGARVLGVDREDAVLEVAAERVHGLPNVELRRGLLDQLPIGDRSVDLAICALVLHHVRELSPVAAEVARILRPGGRWLLVDMVEHDRAEFGSTMGHQHLGFSEDTLATLSTPTLKLERYQVLPPDGEAQGPGLFLAQFRRR